MYQFRLTPEARAKYPAKRPKVFVGRGSFGGWNVFVNDCAVALCGENRARAVAVARDVRAGCDVLPYRLPTRKWL